jgi:hypothetical protein
MVGHRQSKTAKGVKVLRGVDTFVNEVALSAHRQAVGVFVMMSHTASVGTRLETLFIRACAKNSRF